MDRLFIVDPDWDPKLDIDAFVAQYVLQHNVGRTCDHWMLADRDLPYEKRMVPVGDIAWVEHWLSKAKGTPSSIPPIEIPECLRHFCHRDYRIMLGSEIPKELRYGSTFLKDASELKRWNNLLYTGMNQTDMTTYIDPSHLYVVSERVLFLSEWRIFVHQDSIVACQHYLGNPSIFPDGKVLRQMVATYMDLDPSRPKSYTIDVGIISESREEFRHLHPVRTEPIEIHPFVSCGLYGFAEPELIPMWEAGWQWCLENACNTM